MIETPRDVFHINLKRINFSKVGQFLCVNIRNNKMEQDVLYKYSILTLLKCSSSLEVKSALATSN